MIYRPIIPSPAIAFVGRHNSGKTTLIEKLIAELTNRGLDVGSVKHHTHGNFEIDVPGKDSYRHKLAGATEVVIASPVKLARVRDLDDEVECCDIVESMPGHDIVIVEGYRKSGLPSIEIMRKDNERDVAFSKDFLEILKCTNLGNSSEETKVVLPKAVVSDISQVVIACENNNIPVFGFEDIFAIADYLERFYVRRKITLVIQAGGESKRMGHPKEDLVFEGKHVIESQIERFRPYVDEVVITSNHPDRLNFIKPNASLPIKVCRDTLPKQGALSGMYTAFSESTCPRVCCIACDMLFASEHLLSKQIEWMNKTGADIIIPVNKHGREPFHALYNRQSCLKAVKDALSKGETRVQGFLDDENLVLCEMNQSEVREAVPRGGCFVNINTPEDYERFCS